MTVDLAPVRAFLDAAHLERARQTKAFCAERLSAFPPSPSDEAARKDARAMLTAMGSSDVLAPIAASDSRGCCAAREELAYHSPLADAVFALQALGATPLLLGGSEEHARVARRAVAGELMGAFAMTEPDAGSDAHSIATEARREGDAYVLSGRKTFISNAGIADFYVVFARIDGVKGLTAFVVDATNPGFHFVRPLVMSAPHPLGEIEFRACRIPASSRVGEEGHGLRLALSTLDRLRATVGAAACGMAARALDEAITHARSRRQFGKPLAEFQLVQDKIARMATALRAARLLVYQAAWEKDQGAARVTLESGMAKAFATENAQTIVDDAVQILGGKGVLQDSITDLLYRSVRALRIYEGTTEIQRLLVAGQILRTEA